jgi:hypothetical protein
VRKPAPAAKAESLDPRIGARRAALGSLALNDATAPIPGATAILLTTAGLDFQGHSSHRERREFPQPI